MAKLKNVTPETIADHTYQNDVLIPSINALYDLAHDYIIESGSGGDAHWEKWHSGKMVQWGIHKTKNVINEAYGTLFRSPSIEMTYPIPFKELESFNVTSATGPNNFVVYAQGAWLTVMQFRAVHVVTKTQTEIDIAWQAVGKWK